MYPQSSRQLVRQFRSTDTGRPTHFPVTVKLTREWQLDSTHRDSYIVATFPDARASRRLFCLSFASLCQISLTGQVTDETVPFSLLIFPTSLVCLLFCCRWRVYFKSLSTSFNYIIIKNEHTFFYKRIVMYGLATQHVSVCLKNVAD